jgi:hypothetical protein
VADAPQNHQEEKTMSEWSQGMDARLRSLVAEGQLNYREIGETMSREFRKPISKGSAIGRMRRLVEKAKPKPKPKSKEVQPVTLAELERQHCRWPIGEQAPYLYCAHKISEGAPYCPKHCRISYNGFR